MEESKREGKWKAGRGREKVRTVNREGEQKK